MARFNNEELIILKEQIKFSIDCIEDALSDYNNLKNISDEDITEDDLQFGEKFNKDKVIKDLNKHKSIYNKICKIIKLGR